MKYWHILVLFLVGFAITIIGALFKILHWPGAALMLMLGMGLKAFTVVLLIIKIIQNRKSSHIFNK
jgi:hypothetical protein